MHKQLLPKIKQLISNLIEEFRIRVIRPIQKRRRRAQFLKHRESVLQAKGELLENLQPLLMQILDQTLSDYHEAIQQNHYTIQARHDIRRMYEIKIKSLIGSQK